MDSACNLSLCIVNQYNCESVILYYVGVAWSCSHWAVLYMTPNPLVCLKAFYRKKIGGQFFMQERFITCTTTSIL